MRVLFEELLSVIEAIVDECKVTHAAAERQYEMFQARIRAAIMGDDVEYKHVSYTNR